jgi:dUTP pyrophosphatase
MDIKFFLEEDDAKVPRRASDLAAGLDLYSSHSEVIEKGERKLISTGISMALPSNTYGQIAPRSGLATKGIDIGAGIIDEDYLGVVKVLLINNGNDKFVVEKGTRIAQLLVKPILYPTVTQVSDKKLLGTTTRGSGGFGSTGLK